MNENQKSNGNATGWSTHWRDGKMFVELTDAAGNLLSESFHDFDDANKVRDAHNNEISALRLELEQAREALREFASILQDMDDDNPGNCSNPDCSICKRRKRIRAALAAASPRPKQAKIP